MSAITIDWSGAKRPAGKIWVAEASRGRLRRLEPLPTRDEAVDQLALHLRDDPTSVAGLDFTTSSVTANGVGGNGHLHGDTPTWQRHLRALGRGLCRGAGVKR